VDLQSAAEFRRLLAEALDLRLHLLVLAEKLVELPLGDDELVIPLFRTEERPRIPSGHLPSGRGLTTSRI
jgi:hypothetical protein